MFGTHDLAPFVISGLLLNLTPGPDTLYIVGRSTTQGWRAGVVAGARHRCRHLRAHRRRGGWAFGHSRGFVQRLHRGQDRWCGLPGVHRHLALRSPLTPAARGRSLAPTSLHNVERVFEFLNQLVVDFYLYCSLAEF
jgi:hypothetical protein